MRFVIPALALLSLQEPATLPPVRRVTLDLEDVPFYQAMERLQEASGFKIGYQGSWLGRFGPGAWRPPSHSVTLKLAAVPFVEAVGRMSQTGSRLGVSPWEGGVNFAFDGAGEHLGYFCDGLFAFQVFQIEKSLATDFAEETRACEVKLLIWWQPDLSVVDLQGFTLDEATDDLGNDLRLPQPRAEEESIREKCSRRALKLSLPPRKARTIARLRGSVEIGVPGGAVRARFDFKDLLLPGEE